MLRDRNRAHHQYGRTHELFRSLFMSADWNQNEAIEDGRMFEGANYPQAKAKKIGAGSTLSCNMTPLLGFMASGCYLPLRYAPLEPIRVRERRRRPRPHA